MLVVSEDQSFLNILASAKAGNPDAFNHFFVGLLPLIKNIAGGLAKRGVCLYYPYDDLVQEGIIGLWDAIVRCEDIDNVYCFIGYAKIRIEGQMIDSLRRNSNVPRSITDGLKVYRRFKVSLEHVLQRPPTLSEIESGLPKTLKHIFADLRLIDEGGVNISITTYLDDGYSLFDRLSDDTTLEDLFYQAQLFDRIKGFLSGGVPLLKKREREVLDLYYFSELSLREIGEVIGVTESRVCQIKNLAIRKIQQNLK